VSLKRVTPPTELPLTLQEVKEHLRILHEDDDAALMFYLRSATDQLDGAAGILNRALLTQAWELQTDGKEKDIELPLPPLQAVTEVASGSPPLDPNTFTVANVGNSTRRGIVKLGSPAEVTITFTCGYGARNDIPEHIQHLILFMVQASYDARQMLVPSNLMKNPAFESLLHQARFLVL
jgi:uncharacterized phiE125 gp8 family phage protein